MLTCDVLQNSNNPHVLRKKECNSLCRRKCEQHKKIIANKVTNLIEARDVQVFECFHERKLHGQTPFPEHVWTDYLKGHTKTDKCSKRSGP